MKIHGATFQNHSKTEKKAGSSVEGRRLQTTKPREEQRKNSRTRQEGREKCRKE